MCRDYWIPNPTTVNYSSGLFLTIRAADPDRVSNNSDYDVQRGMAHGHFCEPKYL